MEKDVYLKDEGKFITVVFQSEKAKEALKREPQMVIDNTYGKEIPKLNIPLNAKNDAIAWCASNDLTIEDF